MAHSQGEKIEALKHVAYEVWMMTFAATQLVSTGDDQSLPEVGVVQNAYLESTLLHARSLADFLVRDSGRKADIRRIDFADEWKPEPDEAVTRVKGSLNDLNKHLAHLTWDRVTNAGPTQWNAAALVTDIVHIADAWSRHLADTDRELFGHFRPHIANALRIVGPRR